MPISQFFNPAVRGAVGTLVCLGASVGCSDGPGVAGPDPDNPIFISSPILSAEHNREWSYTVSVTDPNGDSVAVMVVQSPSWAVFDASNLTLSGTPGWDHIGGQPFRIAITDGTQTVVQSFVLNVTRGEIICGTSFGDPVDSPYVLPFRVGSTQLLEQSYCPSNPTWGHHNWFAYDFDTANGDTLVASREGTVISIRETHPNVGGVCGQGLENFVFIQHVDGTVMSYVHLDKGGALVSVGDAVAQGEPIGLSGNSGCSSGPHVHVALFRDRTNFDRHSTLPLNYSNADGPLDSRGGLVGSQSYQAKP